MERLVKTTTKEVSPSLFSPLDSTWIIFEIKMSDRSFRFAIECLHLAVNELARGLSALSLFLSFL